MCALPHGVGLSLHVEFFCTGEAEASTPVFNLAHHLVFPRGQAELNGKKIPHGVRLRQTIVVLDMSTMFATGMRLL